MTVSRASLVLALILVAGCSAFGSLSGGSASGPGSAFGGKKGERRVQLYDRNYNPSRPQETRALVDQVTGVAIERTTGGAVLTATGLPPMQGYWDGALTSATDLKPEDGVLVLDFRIQPPDYPTRVSTERSRELDVGLFLSAQTLEGVREIRVVAARNQRSIRPR